MDLAYDTTLASPKRYFLPPTETLSGTTPPPTRWPISRRKWSRVIFGAHACDINAINRLTWCSATGVILIRTIRPCRRHVDRGRVVQPRLLLLQPVDADEARFGYDLFLHRLGDKFLVSISSVEAANILESAVDLRDATNEDRIEFRHATRARQAAFNPEIPEIQDAMLMDAFHSDRFGRSWAAGAWPATPAPPFARRASASISRTCSIPTAKPASVSESGMRAPRRSSPWLPAATTSAPRAARVRHRMYHKLNGFLATYDRMLCVGCGRCVKACKADINPIRVLEFFEKKGPKVPAISTPWPSSPYHDEPAAMTGQELMAANPYARGRRASHPSPS